MNGRGVIEFDGWGRGDDDGDADDDWYRSRPGLGLLTRITVIDDQVVDIEREPIDGTRFECAAMEMGRGMQKPPTPEPQPPRHEMELAWLARAVGGLEALSALDDRPLVDDGWDLAEVRMDVRGRTAAVLERVGRLADEVAGPEASVAARRLGLRAIERVPGLLRRSDRDDIAAGAILWASLKANDLIGPDRAVTGSGLQTLCGLKTSPGQRGRSFAQAVCGGPVGGSYSVGFWAYGAGMPDIVVLGSPDLLLSQFRRYLIRVRDTALILRKGTS